VTPEICGNCEYCELVMIKAFNGRYWTLACVVEGIAETCTSHTCDCGKFEPKKEAV
jgi:hypothetical protein